MANHTPHTRRTALAAFAGAAATVCCGDHALSDSGDTPIDGRRAATTVPVTAQREAIAPPGAPEGLLIRPRSAWAAGRPPKRPMGVEDVKFLLVHHTASSNVVRDPAAVIQAVYDFHTSSAKGWPDVVYNFFVAPDGSVWEGRAGSLAGPVVADATGGNQGFSQLVCLIGNHTVTPPTAAATESLARTLAWLTIRHELSPWADTNATFVSRGSNKFPAGSTITTPIISPHRAVTFTICPGDGVVNQLANLRRRVFDLVEPTWDQPGLQRANRVGLRRP